MTADLIRRIRGAEIVRLQDLPADIQERIRAYAKLDILKDEAKENLKIGAVDIEDLRQLWLAGRSPHTVTAYDRALMEFSAWLQGQGATSPLAAKAEHIDHYIDILARRLKANSIRLKICALSSFFSTAQRYGHIQTNPCHGARLPRKEYRKKLRPNSTSTPVMNEAEYRAIVDEINDQASNARLERQRNAARRLLPAVQMMATYGLRVGTLPTVEVYGNYFTCKAKGNRELTFELMPTLHFQNRRPFANVAVVTIQKAFKRVTKKLWQAGVIRHPYSCHDLRHFFAVAFYTQTKDLVSLKEKLGHSSVATTDIYLQALGIDALNREKNFSRTL